MAGIRPEDDDGNAAAKAALVAEAPKRGPTPERSPAISLKAADTLDALAAIWRD